MDEDPMCEIHLKIVRTTVNLGYIGSVQAGIFIRYSRRSDIRGHSDEFWRFGSKNVCDIYEIRCLCPSYPSFTVFVSMASCNVGMRRNEYRIIYVCILNKTKKIPSMLCQGFANWIDREPCCRHRELRIVDVLILSAYDRCDYDVICDYDVTGNDGLVLKTLMTSRARHHVGWWRHSLNVTSLEGAPTLTTISFDVYNTGPFMLCTVRLRLQ